MKDILSFDQWKIKSGHDREQICLTKTTSSQFIAMGQKFAEILSFHTVPGPDADFGGYTNCDLWNVSGGLCTLRFM